MQMNEKVHVPYFTVPSNHFLHIPAKSPQPQVRGLEVFFVQLVEDAVYFVVVDNADDGIVQGRPGVGAVVRLTRVAAVTLDFVPFGEAFCAVII